MKKIGYGACVMSVSIAVGWTQEGQINALNVTCVLIYIGQKLV